MMQSEPICVEIQSLSMTFNHLLGGGAQIWHDAYARHADCYYYIADHIQLPILGEAGIAQKQHFEPSTDRFATIHG
jgi:hypothetical protein